MDEPISALDRKILKYGVMTRDWRLGWMAREINTHDVVRVKTLFSIDIGEGISYSSDDYPWSC